MGKWLKALRPFERAHWSLPLALVVAGIALIAVFPCTPRPEGMWGAFLASVVMIALWTNHLTIVPVCDLKGFVRLIRNAVLDLLRLCLLWITSFMPLAVFLPAYQCHNDRTEVASWLAATSEVRGVIGERIRSNGSTLQSGTELHLDFGNRAVSGFVTNNGQIHLVGNEPAAALVLHPSLVNGTVVWKCQGVPEKVMPFICQREREADQAH